MITHGLDISTRHTLLLAIEDPAALSAAGMELLKAFDPVIARAAAGAFKRASLKQYVTDRRQPPLPATSATNSRTPKVSLPVVRAIDTTPKSKKRLPVVHLLPEHRTPAPRKWASETDAEYELRRGSIDAANKGRERWGS